LNKIDSPDDHKTSQVGLLELEVRRRGAARLAYPPVVAAGRNACTVHHISGIDTKIILIGLFFPRIHPSIHNRTVCSSTREPSSQAATAQTSPAAFHSRAGFLGFFEIKKIEIIILLLLIHIIFY
jgi:hypothetical protein